MDVSSYLGSLNLGWLEPKHPFLTFSGFDLGLLAIYLMQKGETKVSKWFLVGLEEDLPKHTVFFLFFLSWLWVLSIE